MITGGWIDASELYPFHIMKAVDKIRPGCGAHVSIAIRPGSRLQGHTKVEHLGGELPRVPEDGQHV